MTAAKHAAPQDPSFRRSLLRNVGAALGLVVLVAAMFGVLGMIGREDGGIGLAGGAEEGGDEAPTEVPEPPDEEPTSEQPAEGPAGGDPAEGDEPGEEAPAEDAEGSEASAEDQGDDPADEVDEEPAEAPAEPAIDPSTISVQVLDGYQQDGGAAATAVHDQLQEAGYNIIARNPAIAYEVTTVLWTAGHEEEGRQVAQEIGAPEAREQPGNLSTQVNVHVVVGADRG